MEWLKETPHLLQILILLVVGCYSYTYNIGARGLERDKDNVKRDEFREVRKKIDKIYDLLVEKAMDKKEDKKEVSEDE